MSIYDAFLNVHDGEIDSYDKARVLSESVNGVLAEKMPYDDGLFVDTEGLSELLSSWEGVW
jgi:hypothetical protein